MKYRLGCLLNESVSESFFDVVECGEDLRAFRVYDYGVFIVGGGFAVFCAALPAVFFDDDVAAAEVDHGFDADAHALFQYGSATTASVVRDFRVFMHFASDACPHISRTTL